MADQPTKIEQARLLRVSKRLSYGKIAELLGVAKSSVCRWEKNGWELKKGGAPKGNSNAKGHGPPKGSQNNLKTGYYEDISYDTMTDEEKALYLQVDTDPMKVLIRNLKSSPVRKRRMLELRAKVEEEIEEEELHQLEEEGGNLVTKRTVKEKTVRRHALLDKKIGIENAITMIEDLERRNAEALYRIQEKVKEKNKAQEKKAIIFEFKRENKPCE